MTRYRLQDPADTLDWANDWTNFLAAGDTISAHQWTIEPEESPTLLTNPTSASVLVSGLTKGVVYILSDEITTANGIIAERSVTIRCEQR